MGIFNKKEQESLVKLIYSHDLFKRTCIFIIGVLIAALAFNIFILPNDIVYGVSGIAVMLNKVYNIDASLVIMVGSIILLVLSYILMGKEKTATSVIGSFMYPIFIKLTEWVIPYVDFGETEPILIAVFGAIASGFGLGLVFKAGYTTGGTDIVNQILSKYLKMSIGTAMLLTDGLIITCSLFVFGWQKFLYSVVSIYLISIITDKVILGISQSKTFYIITNEEKEVKKYIIDNLLYAVTVIDAHGGYTGKTQKMIMCTVPTKDYFILKEGIQTIDPEAFFLITDAYEVSGKAITKR